MPTLPAPPFQPADAAFAERVRASFARQGVMATLGASLTRVEPGETEITLAWAAGLTQQHGFMHGGVIATVLDTACGYAALSLMPPDAGILTIEFKVNMLAPARGQHFRTVSTVLKPGRTITFAEARTYAVDGGREKLVATMNATLMTVLGRDDVKQ